MGKVISNTPDLPRDEDSAHATLEIVTNDLETTCVEIELIQEHDQPVMFRAVQLKPTRRVIVHAQLTEVKSDNTPRR